MANNGRGGSDDVAAGTRLRVADGISSSRMLGAVSSNASGTPGMWQRPPLPEVATAGSNLGEATNGSGTG